MTTKQPERGIGYVRVSKVGARGDDMLSPDIQETAIRDFAKRQGITLGAIVTDLDQTGRTFAKRQVGAIIDTIARGEADVVIVWKWSRWARNTAEGLGFLAKVMQAGGNVRAATEDFDTSTGVGEFSRDMMLALATLQSNQIGEGWKETHANRRARGLPHTSLRRFGYTVTRESGYVVDEETRDLIADAYERFGAGTVAMRQLVCEWNAAGIPTLTGGRWTPTSLGRMLDTGFAAGLIRERSAPGPDSRTRSTVASFDVWRVGAHEAIIGSEAWDRYQARRAANAAKPRRLVNATHALSGLVTCAVCERGMTTQYSGKERRHAWVCTRGDLPRTHMMTTASNRRLESIVLQWITDHAKGERETAEEARRLDAARGQLVTNLAMLETRRDELVAARKRIARQLAAGRITDEDADEILAEVTDEAQRVEADLRRATETAETSKPDPIVFRGIAAAWEDSTPAGRANLIRPLIGRITVRPGGWDEAEPKAQIVPRWAS